MQAAAVILAAGASTRFGSPKQLAPVGGSTMLEAVVALARAAGLAPIIAVVPPGIPTGARISRVTNADPLAGLSRSLRLGLAAVPPEVGAAVILLGDQPTVPIATIRALLQAGDATDRSVVAARASGRAGPPVLLLRPAFRMADEAAGDEGLRRIIEAHPEVVSTLEVEEHAPDIDTPEDLAAVRTEASTPTRRNPCRPPRRDR